MTAVAAALTAAYEAQGPYASDEDLIWSLRRAVRMLVACVEALDARIAALEEQDVPTGHDKEPS